MMRPGKPAIVSDPLPPKSVVAHGEQIGAEKVVVLPALAGARLELQLTEWPAAELERAFDGATASWGQRQPRGEGSSCISEKRASARSLLEHETPPYLEANTLHEAGHQAPYFIAP